MSDGSGQTISRPAGAVDPGELFIRAWDELALLKPADRSAVAGAAGGVEKALEDALSDDDAATAASRLEGVVASFWQDDVSLAITLENAAILCALMNSIDQRFALIHPRTRILSPRFHVADALPTWLQSAKERRILEGDYVRHGSKRLIPNGPFARHAIGRDFLAGDSLQDRFPHLTVAPVSTRHEDNEIRISMKVVGTGRARGMPAAKSIGCERICFVPLAEAHDDLEFVCGTRSGKSTVDVKPAIDSVERLIDAIRRNNQIDIGFAPELTVGAGEEGKLSGEIVKLLENAPRILLAGSGLTADRDDLGRSWNEARVIARGGATLWRQRKIWPFEMHRDRAREFGLADPGQGQTLNEDIAGHDEVAIVDLDGFGRSMVLICQDFEARTVVDDIVRRYQPDWIFVPILDAGVNVPGWTANRASTLNKSQSRFVIGSSLTLSRMRGDAKDPPIGVAVGPASPTAGPLGLSPLARAIAVINASSDDRPITGVVVWDHRAPVWSQLNQSAALS